jgi:hypothetical protein
VIGEITSAVPLMLVAEARRNKHLQRVADQFRTGVAKELFGCALTSAMRPSWSTITIASGADSGKSREHRQRLLFG